MATPPSAAEALAAIRDRAARSGAGLAALPVEVRNDLESIEGLARAALRALGEDPELPAPPGPCSSGCGITHLTHGGRRRV